MAENKYKASFVDWRNWKEMSYSPNNLEKLVFMFSD